MLFAALSLLIALPCRQEPVPRDQGKEPPKKEKEEDAQPPPAEPLKGRPTVFRVDRVESLDGEPLSNAFVVVRGGVIEKVGQALILPEHAQVHDLRGGGSTLMPPLVLSHANFLQRDGRGRGANGRFRAVDSLYLEEEDLPDLLELGVMLLGVDPPGSGIPGRSSVLEAGAAWPRPQALVNDLHLKLTVDANPEAKELLRKAIAGAEEAIEKEKKAREEWEKARKEWEEQQKAKAAEQKKQEEGKQEGKQEEGGGGEKKGASRAQGEENKGQKEGEEEKEPPKEFEPPPIDPNLVPVVEWLRRERLVQVWLDSPAEWLHWLDLLGERELPYEVVLQPSRFGDAFPEVAAALAAAGVRVYAPAQLSFLPNTRVRVNLPAELLRAGVKNLVLMPPNASFEGVEDWRMGLTELVRHGLERDAALRAVTLQPAAALGQEEKVPALKAGAPATFIVLDGDPLDPTSEVEYVVQDGEVLYDRAKEERKS